MVNQEMKSGYRKYLKIKIETIIHQLQGYFKVRLKSVKHYLNKVLKIILSIRST